MVGVLAVGVVAWGLRAHRRAKRYQEVLLQALSSREERLSPEHVQRLLGALR